MSYDQCKKCKAWSFNIDTGHKCPPKWDVIDDDGDDGKVYASDASGAAEFFAEHVYEWESSDRPIEIAVRPSGSSDAWQHFEVEREWDPTYAASPSTEPTWWERTPASAKTEPDGGDDGTA